MLESVAKLSCHQMFDFSPLFVLIFFLSKKCLSQPQGRDIAADFKADVRHIFHNVT